MITDRERQGEILKQLREEYPLPSKAERKKAYYEENKDKIAEKMKAYYEKNKNKIAERKKAYYEENKDKIAEKMKAYYEKNKDKIWTIAKELKQELSEK